MYSRAAGTESERSAQTDAVWCEWIKQGARLSEDPRELQEDVSISNISSQNSKAVVQVWLPPSLWGWKIEVKGQTLALPSAPEQDTWPLQCCREQLIGRWCVHLGKCSRATRHLCFVSSQPGEVKVGAMKYDVKSFDWQLLLLPLRHFPHFLLKHSSWAWSTSSQPCFQDKIICFVGNYTPIRLIDVLLI